MTGDERREAEDMAVLERERERVARWRDARERARGVRLKGKLMEVVLMMAMFIVQEALLDHTPRSFTHALIFFFHDVIISINYLFSSNGMINLFRFRA